MDNDTLIAVVGCIATFSVPIVWILTANQRKMAEIIHRTHANQSSANNDALANEVRELKQMVFQQAIAMDNLSSEVRKTGAQSGNQEPLSVRLGQQPPTNP